MAEEWRTWPMRQRIILQIDEHLRQNPDVNKKSAQELESLIYQRATKKDEYIQSVSKIIMYLKDQAQNTNQNSSNLTAMLSGQQGNAVGVQSMGQGVTSGGQMTIGNAGSAQMVHSNQPQMVHAGNTGAQIAHGNTSGGQMTHAGVGNQGVVGPGGMVQGTMITGPNRMSQPMASNMSNQSDMVSWQTQPKARRSTDMIMINMNNKHPVMNNMGAMNSQAGKMGTMPMTMSGQSDQVNQMAVGAQMPRQGVTMQPRVPSPSFSVGTGGQHPRQGTPTPTNASPASQQQHGVSHSSLTFISPSPSSNAVPSPVGNAGGGRSMNQLGAPSPSGMINTPGPPQQQQQQQQQPSPAANSGNSEDRAYMEKVKQLQHKYLDTLREVVQKFGNSDTENARKVRNLLEVIENPQRRASKGMDTLKRCEFVLEKLGIQQRETRGEGDPSKLQTKDNPVTVLFDAINLALKSPLGYHTIHRSLSPALKTLSGPDLEPSIPKRLKIEEPLPSTSDIPVISDIVQGEVARLPPRFKVNLDSQQLNGSDDLTLICQLDDLNLPCIPPITLIIPPSYPNAPPRCRLSMVDYESTTFLKKLREIMINRQFHLPEVCSMTMLLDAWEMSVRRACSSKPFVPDAINPLINLNILS